MHPAQNDQNREPPEPPPMTLSEKQTAEVVRRYLSTHGRASDAELRGAIELEKRVLFKASPDEITWDIEEYCKDLRRVQLAQVNEMVRLRDEAILDRASRGLSLDGHIRVYAKDTGELAYEALKRNAAEGG